MENLSNKRYCYSGGATVRSFFYLAKINPASELCFTAEAAVHARRDSKTGSQNIRCEGLFRYQFDLNMKLPNLPIGKQDGGQVIYPFLRAFFVYSIVMASCHCFLGWIRKEGGKRQDHALFLFGARMQEQWEERCWELFADFILES